MPDADDEGRASERSWRGGPIFGWLGVLFFAACTVPRPELGPDHPGSPQAREGVPAVSSASLAGTTSPSSAMAPRPQADPAHESGHAH
jgi:hypothetical protein